MDFVDSPKAVTVSLVGKTVGKGGHAEGDTFVQVENVVGSAGADKITGTSDDNTLEGGDGDDELSAGGGDDTLDGGAGDDDLSGGDGDDLLIPGFGKADKVDGGNGVDTLQMLGTFDDYTIEYLDDGSITLTDGTNKVTATTVEFAKFTDKTTLLQKAPNKPPTAKSPALERKTAEDKPLIIKLADIVASASDPEGDAVQFDRLRSVSVGEVTHIPANEALKYTPPPFYFGAAVVTLDLSDGRGNQVTVVLEITVTPVNNAPVAQAGTLSLPAGAKNQEAVGQVRATDIDLDTLEYALVSDPDVGTVVLAKDGTYTFSGGGDNRLPPGQTTSFKFKATDPDLESSTATVTVQLTGRVDLTLSAAIEVTAPTEAKAQYAFGLFDEKKTDTGTTEGLSKTSAIQLIGAAKIATLASGAVIMVWAGVEIDGDQLGIAGRLYDDVGNAITPSFQVNTFTTGRQSNPAVSSLADGGFVVVWNSFDQDSSGFGIYGQRYVVTSFSMYGTWCWLLTANHADWSCWRNHAQVHPAGAPERRGVRAERCRVFEPVLPGGGQYPPLTFV